eukprot:382907-Rhodomonas_salina.1
MDKEVKTCEIKYIKSAFAAQLVVPRLYLPERVKSAIILRWCYAMAGTDVAYGATRSKYYLERFRTSSDCQKKGIFKKGNNVTGVDATPGTLCSALRCPRMMLPVHAMSGTGLAYGAICLRASYATPSTDAAYATALRNPTQETALSVQFVPNAVSCI